MRKKEKGKRKKEKGKRKKEKGEHKVPRFRNMRERVEYAYDELNVDIYYEGDYYYTILDHSRDKFVKMLTEEELDVELERIWIDLNISSATSGRSI